MWCARRKRSSVSRPPCGGGGGRRTPARASSVASSASVSIAAQWYATDAIVRPCDDARPMGDADLAARLLAGDRRALARAISLVEDDRPEGWALVREIYPHTGAAQVVGFTGPPGVGKSTLIGAVTAERRAAGRTVGVLSIDPSSPFTHGALLGDRVRLSDHYLDEGVFIRSMANRGALGGLSEAALQAVLLLDAAGRQDVFVETVGVGQAEVDIIDHADTIVLVLMPGSGDSIQALKAGVMEIPDVIVVNKADHPLTDTMVREIRSVLSLADDRAGPDGPSWSVPIVRTDALGGAGVAELTATLVAHHAHIVAAGQLAERRARNLRAEVLSLATARMRRRLEQDLEADSEFEELMDEVVARRLDPASAAEVLLRREDRPGSGDERPRDHHLLDLVGALTDREDLRVAVEAAHRILLHVAVAAVDLDRLLGAADRQAPRLELRLRRRQREVAARVLLHRRLVNEQPRRLDLGRHVGELGLDRLEARDRPAERVALAGVRERLVQRALREADAHRGDADPAAVEDLQELPQSRAAGAEQVLLRNAAVGERQRPRVRGVPAHLAVGLARLVAGRAVGDDEVGDLAPPVAVARP